VAIQYAYDSNVAAGNLTLSGGITLSSTSTLDAVRSGGLIDITTTAISGSGSLNIASSASSGGVVRFSVANTYSGTTTINSGATLELANVNALQNTTLDTGTSGSQVVTLTVAGANTYNIGAIQGGDTLDFGNNTISVGANNATTSFTGTLAGAGGSLTKAGTGTLTLSASNTYDGTTTISAGTIQIDHANALGAGGNITFGGGGLKYGTGITQDLSSRIKNSSSAILVDTNGQSVTWGNALGSTNSSGLTKNGTGTLTLSANNTYAGATTINTGTLEISGAGRLGGGSYAGNITIAGAFTYNSTADQTLSGLVSGAGYMAKVGTGTLTLSGSNTMSGTLDIFGGTVRLEHSSALGTKLVEFEDGSTIMFGTSGLNIGNSITVRNAGGSNSRSIILDLAGTNTGTFSGQFDIRKSNIATFDVGADDTLSMTGNIVSVAGGGGFTKIGAGTLVLTGASSSYLGTTVINAGTLQIGGGSTTGALNSSAYGVNNNSKLAFNRSNDITVANVISGTGVVLQNGSGTLTLTGNNTYSGGTTLNTGTLVIGHAKAGGSGMITQSSGSSLLKIDTTGTIANAMSIYNVSANKTVTLSGGIQVHNATFDVASGETLTISNTINGTGGVTKNGTGTLVLSGSNSNTGATTVNAGTLNAASANALGSTSNVVVSNGGSFLVTAGDSVNDSSAVTLAGGTLAVNGTFNESVGLLTLSANSVIDLDGFTGTLRFGGVGSWSTDTTLAIWNWNGNDQYGTAVGNGADNRHVVFTSNTGLDAYLGRISFYSDSGSSFAGTGFEQAFTGGGTEIIPVPEPETWATGILLVLSSGMWLWRKRKQVA
jgi:autotransporter-associated beta strand protein